MQRLGGALPIGASISKDVLLEDCRLDIKINGMIIYLKAEETGSSLAGAEGATAPESLRQTDRAKLTLEAVARPKFVSPTNGSSLVQIHRGNLPG